MSRVVSCFSLHETLTGVAWEASALGVGDAHMEAHVIRDYVLKLEAEPKTDLQSTAKDSR